MLLVCAKNAKNMLILSQKYDFIAGGGAVLALGVLSGFY